MTLALPISIVTIDNVAHELTTLALVESLRKIQPVQVLILTNDRTKISIPGADYYFFNGGYLEVMHDLWYRVPSLIAKEATHLLWLQWDSEVLNATAWDPAFLDCDYVGAPWPMNPGSSWPRLGYTAETNVGNGGFSLRSRRLINYLADHGNDLPLILPEDDAICRKHRQKLSEVGFNWAKSDLAQRFSFEIGDSVIVGSTFGFHNALNWAWALTREQRYERIARASDFVKRHGTFKKMLEFHTQVPDAVLGQTIGFNN